MRKTVLMILAGTAACVAIYATTTRSERPTPGRGLEITDVKSSSACRGLCLTVDKRPVRIGEQITGTISWNHAVPGSSLNVYLTPTIDQSGHATNPARHGSLMRRTFTISTESGSFRFRWRGSGFWCSPTDFPMICNETPSADTYWIRAVVMDSGVIPMAVLQRAPSSNPAKPPKVLAEVNVGPFPLR